MQYQSLAIWKHVANLWSRFALEPPIDPEHSLERGIRALMMMLDATRADIRIRITGGEGPEENDEATDRLVFTASPRETGANARSGGAVLTTTLEPVEQVEATLRIARPKTSPSFTRADEQVLEIATDGLVHTLASLVRINGLLPHQTRLNAREQRVVTLMAGGHQSAELAKMLEIDPDNIDTIIDGILDKLGVASRVELLHLVMARAPGKSPIIDVGDAANSLSNAPAEKTADPFLQRVVDAIQAKLDAEQLSTQAVARKLGVSKRTLQRKLAATNTTFRRMTDRARHQRALELLANPSVDYTDVAHQLGYGHVSSLNRALQRWTGETPSEVRKALRGGR